MSLVESIVYTSLVESIEQIDEKLVSNVQAYKVWHPAPNQEAFYPNLVWGMRIYTLKEWSVSAMNDTSDVVLFDQ